MKSWQGLGYNRRALSLKTAAQVLVNNYNGKIPRSREELKKLPGVGEATAASVCAFAFGKSVVFIETNIRSVFIHLFFKSAHAIKDSQILPLIEQTLDINNPRQWYYALMDYGVFLKERFGNPSRGSAHYRKQSPFHGSNRQLRGRLLKVLVNKKRISVSSLSKQVEASGDVVSKALEQLLKEGLVKKTRNKVMTLS